MKKFFIKDLANMVEKEIATEFLLRKIITSICFYFQITDKPC